MSRYPRSPLSGSHPIDRAVALRCAAEILRTTDERSQGCRLGRFRVARPPCVWPPARRTPSAGFGVLRYFPLPYTHAAPFRSSRRCVQYSSRRLPPLHPSSYNSERNRVDPERGAPRGEKVRSENSITFYRILAVVLRRSLKLLAVRAANAAPVLSASPY